MYTIPILITLEVENSVVAQVVHGDYGDIRTEVVQHS